jgi:hypothetical protein
LFTAEGVRVLVTFTEPGRFVAGTVRATCLVPGALLNDGYYRIGLVIARDQVLVLAEYGDVVSFVVHDVARPGSRIERWPGVIRPRLEWAVVPPPP